MDARWILEHPPHMKPIMIHSVKQVISNTSVEYNNNIQCTKAIIHVESCGKVIIRDPNER